MSEPEIPQTATLLLAPHDTLDRILVIRSVDGFPTHWMNHYGAWMSLPDTLQGMQDLMVQLDEDPTLLPLIDMEYVNVPDDFDQGSADHQIPFGD